MPCCGPGQELPLLHELLVELGEGQTVEGCTETRRRMIKGTDLSVGMVEIASARASKIGPHVSAAVEDAMKPPSLPPNGGFAIIFSVFGLQQLPDPSLALSRWVAALAPGGLLVVGFWPYDIEASGPFATFRRIVAARNAAASNQPDNQEPPAWESALTAACEGSGGVVEVDRHVTHAMRWESAERFWEAMTKHGPGELLARRYVVGGTFRWE